MDILHIDEMGIQRAIVSAAIDIIGGCTVDDDYIVDMWEMKVISAAISIKEAYMFERIQEAVNYIREHGTGDNDKDEKNIGRLMSAAIRVANNHEVDCDSVVGHLAYVNAHGANVEEMKDTLLGIGAEIGRRNWEGYKNVAIEHREGKIYVVGKSK